MLLVGRQVPPPLVPHLPKILFCLYNRRLQASKTEHVSAPPSAGLPIWMDLTGNGKLKASKKDVDDAIRL